MPLTKTIPISEAASIVHAMREPGSGRRRRNEVEHRLAALPPRPGRRGFPRPVVAGGEERQAARRWRDALAQLGPVFATCGRHLAGRLDVLPRELCRELATLDDRAPATPAPMVRACVERELGNSPEELFARFEERPQEARLLFQSHRAWLAGGEPLTVKLVRPELDAYLAQDLELLALLAPGLRSWAVKADEQPEIHEALAAARSAIENELDLLREADSLTALSGAGSPELRIPRVYGGLSTRRVLTTERPDSMRLTELDFGRREAAEGSERLAFRLCLAWLRQVLLGCRFPLAPTLENLAVTADHRFVVQAGGFARPRPGWQAQLWPYLAAAAAHEPDHACSALLAMMEASDGDQEALRLSFRQIQPLRDPAAAARGDHLPEYLLVQWKLATEHGCRSQPALIDLNRSLAALQETVHRLAPERDALAAAFDELRLETELGRWRQRMDVDRLGHDLRSFAELVSSLPRTFDAALASVADEGVRVKLDLREPLAGRRSKRGSLVVPLLFLALLAVTLLDDVEPLALVTALSERSGAFFATLVAVLFFKSLVE